MHRKILIACAAMSVMLAAQAATSATPSPSQVIIASGQLQTPIPPGGADETGALLRSMTVMQDNIREMMARETALRRSAENRLSDALETLPIEQWTAFVLAEIQELPHAEIAMIEQIEVGTVKSRVSRARDKLRQAMQAWQPERVVHGSTRKIIGNDDTASENRNRNAE